MTGPPAGPVGLETLVQGRKSKGAAAAAPFGLAPLIAVPPASETFLSILKVTTI